MLSEGPTCAVCKKSSSLRCQSCFVIHYCGTDHQALGWSAHKKVCKVIKKAKPQVELEYDLLQSDPVFQGVNIFDRKGDWLKFIETHRYLGACYDVIESLLKVKTHAAVRAAHDQLMNCLVHDRRDGMGARLLIPTVKLRLGRDQDCYDYLKWYLTIPQDSNLQSTYDWGDFELPSLHLQGEDPLEELPTIATDQLFGVNPTVALLLLKVKMKLDLGSIQQVSLVVGSRVPLEIFDEIISQLRISDTISSRPFLMKAQDLNPWIIELESHISALVDATFEQNPHFWKLMLDPGHHLTARPPYTESYSLEEAQLALQHNYDSWMETPGAMELIKEHLKKRARKLGHQSGQNQTCEAESADQAA